jgi:hypothetical protein
MQQAGLDFQQAPPISVPFRFFLTAPVFALLSAAVMLWQGADLFASRWSPATLAAVHLLTLGTMTMVMTGAMIQILPVLVGTPVPKPRLVAAIVHSALLVGTLLFAGGFLFAQPLLLKIAITVLGVGLTAFLAVMLLVLSRTRNPTPTVYAIGLATAALGVTLVLGLTLAASRAWGIALPNPSLRDLHPGWGLMGWTGLLVVGVAYQIVPMFQITPNYPRWLMRGFAVMVFGLLMLLSVAQWQGDAAGWWWVSLICICLLAAAFILLAGVTLNLQRLRRRRLPDLTLEFWRVGMACVVLAALLWVSQRFPVLSFPQADVLLGVLIIFGAAMSFIRGMLCKIVPFLAWFHLQAKIGIGGKIPNVKSMLPEKAQRVQLQLHIAALVLWVAAALLPSIFAFPAALCFGAASASVLWNMIGVARLYRNFDGGAA